MNNTIFNLCQWINYTFPGKIPSAPVNDPSAWSTYDQAYNNDPHHIGFVFTASDPYFLIDIDHCTHPDGSWNDTALMLRSMFQGCYMERSVSGTGCHIIGRGPTNLPHSCDNKDIGTQFYTQERYVALTWVETSGDIEFIPDETTYRAFVKEWYAPKEITTPALTQAGPVPEWSGPTDDNELIEKMKASKQGGLAEMQGKPSFHDLWHANKYNLSHKIPREHDPEDFDWSMADSALCGHLAFWTGKDQERIVRLWSMSALGARDKFRDRPDYVTTTVAGACAKCSNVYNDGKTVPLVAGLPIMFKEDQEEHFKGCVLITYPSAPKVLMPDGRQVSQGTFRADMGHKSFIFDVNGQKTTKDAWEAFTNSQIYTPETVVDTCFRPDLPTGHIITDDETGYKLINTHRPPLLKCCQGDPGPFLDLLTRVLPDERDRTILLSYMAAVVQYPGTKFRWAPVLQGVEGNGKSKIVEFVAYCMGKNFSENVNTTVLKSQFNGWLSEKTFVYGDEMNGDSENTDIILLLKSLITDLRVSIQKKGVDHRMEDNRVNFMFCMNNKNVLKKHKNDRRLAMFYMKQQNVYDIERDGLGGDYFVNLADWHDNHNGFGIVNHYLRNYQIPDEFNPATKCHRAPETSTTSEAILESRSTYATIITEAIEQGMPGFYGGWLSSIAVSKLLFEETGRKVNPKQIGLAIKELGYIKLGLAYRVVPEEGKKPYLYKKEMPAVIDMPALTIEYCQAQGYVV